MFEKYTQNARRMIFYARYEASLIGSKYIAPEHLLLGMLGSGKYAVTSMEEFQAVRKGIREALLSQLPALEAINPSVDLPLTDEAKQILHMAEEEADGLGHRHIGVEHLLMGLLRQPGQSAQLLNQFGLTYEGIHDKFDRGVVKPDWRRALEDLQQAVTRGLSEEDQVALRSELQKLAHNI